MILLPRPAILNVVQELLVNGFERKKFSGLYSFHVFISDVLIEDKDVERFIAFMIKTRANGEWIEKFLSLKTPLDAIELVKTNQWQKILNRFYTHRNFEVFKFRYVDSAHALYLRYKNNFKNSIQWKNNKIERIKKIENIDDPIIAFI